MGNTFITPTAVARDAAIAASDRLKVGNLVSRDKEGLFTAAKIGDEVTVTVPPAVTDASEFTGSTSATDHTETSVGLKLEKHFYKRIDLTSKQKSLELSDFTRLVTVPAITGMMDSADKFILRNMQVFRRNLTGTVGNRPSSIAHIAAATKKLNDLRVNKMGRVALIDTTVEESFSQLSAFQSQDYGPDAPGGLREAILGRRYGFNFETDVNAGAFVRSVAANDIAGSPVIITTVAAGGTQIGIDGVTNATGTIYAGTVFTIAGDTTRYVVRKDVTAVGNAYATIDIYPALAAQATAEAVISFEAAGYSNLVYHPGAVAAALVAPEPLAGGNSVVQSFNGISIRVSMDSSIVTLSDSIVYDVFVGCRVIQPDGGALFCG
jgi:hypothetical protein